MGWALSHPSRLLLGIPFSATLLTILLAHEMGHYLLCRYYDVRATLPFFIPAPTLIGTLGAVIRIKAPIRSRAALFDIGIAGPIAGFIVAIITLGIAMTLSKPYAPGIGASDLRVGFPAIFYIVHDAMRATGLENAIAALPMRRVYLHPTAIAAWVGMFATALNLLPSSQLDGGHIVYAAAPRIHRAVSWATVVVLLYLGRTYVGWWLWAGSAYRDEHPDVPPTASPGIPFSSSKPLAAGNPGAAHAAADVHGHAVPDVLEIARERYISHNASTSTITCVRGIFCCAA